MTFHPTFGHPARRASRNVVETTLDCVTAGAADVQEAVALDLVSVTVGRHWEGLAVHDLSGRGVDVFVGALDEAMDQAFEDVLPASAVREIREVLAGLSTEFDVCAMPPAVGPGHVRRFFEILCVTLDDHGPARRTGG